MAIVIKILVKRMLDIFYLLLNSTSLTLVHYPPLRYPIIFFPPTFSVSLPIPTPSYPFHLSLHQPHHIFETSSARLFPKSKEACNSTRYSRTERICIGTQLPKKWLLKTANAKQCRKIAFNDSVKFFLCIFKGRVRKVARGVAPPLGTGKFATPAQEKPV